MLHIRTHGSINAGKKINFLKSTLLCKIRTIFILYNICVVYFIVAYRIKAKDLRRSDRFIKFVAPKQTVSKMPDFKDYNHILIQLMIMSCGYKKLSLSLLCK